MRWAWGMPTAASLSQENVCGWHSCLAYLNGGDLHGRRCVFPGVVVEEALCQLEACKMLRRTEPASSKQSVSVA